MNRCDFRVGYYSCGHRGGGASTFHPSPDGRSVVGGSRLIKKHAVGQILIQVSAFHVLGDHAERIVADTHPQETDDVGVLQAGQDLHLFQEVVSAGREEREHLVYFTINTGKRE